MHESLECAESLAFDRDRLTLLLALAFPGQIQLPRPRKRHLVAPMLASDRERTHGTLASIRDRETRENSLSCLCSVVKVNAYELPCSFSRKKSSSTLNKRMVEDLFFKLCGNRAHFCRVTKGASSTASSYRFSSDMVRSNASHQLHVVARVAHTAATASYTRRENISRKAHFRFRCHNNWTECRHPFLTLYAQADATAASIVQAAGGIRPLFALALGDEPAFNGKERSKS